MTPPLREETPPAVRASRPAPITPQVLFRVLALATGIPVFMILLGPTTHPSPDLLKRWTLYFAFSWAGTLLGLGSVRLLFHMGVWPRQTLLGGVLTGLTMFLPMSVVVWLGLMWAHGGPLPASALAGLFWDNLLICLAASSVSVLIARRNTVVVVEAAAPAPPKFLDRLPLKLRGAEIWAVEAEDHYLRLHTSKGQDLILMRLADAVAELEGIEGLQVHRSWWVARDAITDAKRGDGRATLTLKDGSEVPASRTYAAELRKRGWI